MKKITSSLLMLIALASLSFGQATKRVILEDETDAGCGYCPRGTTIAEYIVANYPNVTKIANHVTAIGPDLMANSYSLGIDAMNTYGYPGGMIDRTLFSGQSAVVVATNYWESYCVSELSQSTPFQIDVTANYNSVTRAISATVTVTYVGPYTSPTGTGPRISCVLVEDSVVGSGTGYDQHNYMGVGCGATDASSPWYTYPCIIPGFVHDGVARKNLAPVWGTPSILPTSGTTGQVFTVNYSNTLTSTWRENKMKIVAFVSLYATSVNSRNILNANWLPYSSWSGPTGVVDPQSNVTGFDVFPNPANDFVTVKAELKAAATTHVAITDILGHTVFASEYKTSGNQFAENIPVGNLVNGIYFVTITNQDSKITQKVLVSRSQK